MTGQQFEAVLAAAQRGDEAAFSRLWRDGNPALLRYLRVMAPDVAEGAATATWQQVMRGLAGFRGDERAWLFTTARRHMAGERRRRSRPIRAPRQLPPAGLPVPADAVGLAMERSGTQPAMALVTRRPAGQAEVILLRTVAGLDNQTVARLVRRCPGAVRVAAHQGRRRMAEILAEAGAVL